MTQYTDHLKFDKKEGPSEDDSILLRKGNKIINGGRGKEGSRLMRGNRGENEVRSGRGKDRSEAQNSRRMNGYMKLHRWVRGEILEIHRDQGYEKLSELKWDDLI